MAMSEDNFWINKAFRWTKKHPNVVDTSSLEIKDNLYQFTAIFEINLPGNYDLQGKTKHGINKYEPVLFVFPKDFPYRAPKIFLRDDFSRNFPHINPIIEKVSPCIFDGSLDELLQQPKWFDHILDQVVEWLENAAANTLISASQGWEPIRMDYVNGLIIYSKQKLLELIFKSNRRIENLIISYEVRRENLYAIIGDIKIVKHQTEILIFKPSENKICDQYFPNFINRFSDLVNLSRIIGINNFVSDINKFLKRNNFASKNKKIIFLIFAANRPFKLINSDFNIELLNFAIELKYQKKNGNIHFKSKVYTLAHRDISTPELLRQFSGVEKSTLKNIIQVGCGSLGSKIALHLARNGNDSHFTLVDNSLFSPHNNARHALINFFGGIPKAKLLETELKSLGIDKVEAIYNDILDVLEKIMNNKKHALLIDSTANISIRNFLAKSSIDIPIIHTSLYSQGRVALMVIESQDRNPRLDDLLTVVYHEALYNSNLRNKLLSENAIYRSIGQGCGSYTTICPDSVISLSAAGMAGKIQQYLNYGLPKLGEVFIGYIDPEDMSISWERMACGKVEVLPPENKADFEVRILPNVIENMNSSSIRARPNETGGALIGHISLTNNIIIVSDLIGPPEDSKFSSNYFELGVKGLKKRVKNIETQSNGLLTYVGTWHSHPNNCSASPLDIKTKQKLYELRDYEPTVCLIWTPEGIVRV